MAGVSSNYGNAANNSAYGADDVLDGDPRTEWSSNGDGNHAWIEIELSTETHALMPSAPDSGRIFQSESKLYYEVVNHA